MRNLASIQKVVSISTIYDKEGKEATSIEAVQILGWTCVAAKGQHRVGELVVYFEIDSIIPEALLRKLNLWDNDKLKGKLSRKGGDVLATKRMLGVLSQGLVASVSDTAIKGHKVQEGEDVTEILGIKKYEQYSEPELVEGSKQTKFQKALYKNIRKIIGYLSHRAPYGDYLMSALVARSHFLRGVVGGGGPFPSFIFKTDQERVQNLTRKLDDLVLDKYEVTEKMEGTSATYFYNKGDAGMCSRNLRLSNYATSHFGQIQKRHNIFERLKNLKMNIAIQGEICGPGIQGNYYGLTEFRLFIFDVFLIDEKRKALPQERTDILYKLNLNSHRAPLLDVRDFSGYTLEDLLKEAVINSTIAPTKMAEGIVLKAFYKQNNFKIINNEYLLKQK